MDATHSYHATQVLTAAELSEYELTARRQEDLILAFFRSRPSVAMSPERVHEVLQMTCPLTSVRRAITNLTNQGQLVQTGEVVAGLYGRPVGTWRLAQKSVKQLELFEQESGK